MTCSTCLRLSGFHFCLPTFPTLKDVTGSVLPGLRVLGLDYDASSSWDVFAQLQQLKLPEVIQQVRAGTASQHLPSGLVQAIQQVFHMRT